MSALEFGFEFDEYSNPGLPVEVFEAWQTVSLHLRPGYMEAARQLDETMLRYAIEMSEARAQFYSAMLGR